MKLRPKRLLNTLAALPCELRDLRRGIFSPTPAVFACATNTFLSVSFDNHVKWCETVHAPQLALETGAQQQGTFSESECIILATQGMNSYDTHRLLPPQIMCK